MKYIKITFNDDTSREWHHEGRAGGSYTKTLETDDSGVRVTDEWGHSWWYPSCRVKSVEARE